MTDQLKEVISEGRIQIALIKILQIVVFASLAVRKCAHGQSLIWVQKLLMVSLQSQFQLVSQVAEPY